MKYLNIENCKVPKEIEKGARKLIHLMLIYDIIVFVKMTNSSKSLYITVQCQ